MAEQCNSAKEISGVMKCDRPAGHPGDHTGLVPDATYIPGGPSRHFWVDEIEGGRELPQCSKCGREIMWIETEQRADKPAARAPVDLPILSVITEEGKTVRGRQSHFATCPNAAEFRLKPGPEMDAGRPFSGRHD